MFNSTFRLLHAGIEVGFFSSSHVRQRVRPRGLMDLQKSLKQRRGVRPPVPRTLPELPALPRDNPYLNAMSR